MEFGHTSYMQLWPNSAYRTATARSPSVYRSSHCINIIASPPLEISQLSPQDSPTAWILMDSLTYAERLNVYPGGLFHLVGARPGSTRARPALVDPASPHLLEASPSNFTTPEQCYPTQGGENSMFYQISERASRFWSRFSDESTKAAAGIKSSEDFGVATTRSLPCVDHSHRKRSWS